MHAAEWERMHGLLLAFKERERHCNVPHWHEEQGAKLGYWLNRQRQAYKHGTLETRREQILEAADMSCPPLVARLAGGAGVPRAGDGVAADSHRALPPPLPHHGARTPLQSHGGRPVQGGAQTSARPNPVLLWLLAAGRPPAGQAGSAGGHGAR